MAARQHHYVPRFFLAGFADSDGFVHSLDVEQGRWWKGKPETLARERDFYRVEGPDLQPNEVEEGFARIEAELAPALHRVRETRMLPSGDDFDLLLNLIAMLAARVPGARRAFTEPTQWIGEHFVGEMFRSPRMYESFLADLRSKGEDTTRFPSFETLKEAYERQAFKIEVSQNFQVAMMLQAAATILPMLVPRNWGLISIASHLSGPFVCSDRPVNLYWTKSVPAFYSPGFGTGDTELLLPLSSDLALLSSFEPLPQEIRGDQRSVAVANSRMLDQAERFIFASTPLFPVVDERGELADSDYALSVIQQRRSQGSSEQADA